MTLQKGGMDGNSLSEDENKLLNLLSKRYGQDITVPSLAENMDDISSEAVLRIADSLSKMGYRILYNRPKDVLRLSGEEQSKDVTYPEVGKVIDHFKIGIIAEPRIGSKQQQMQLLRGVYEGLFTKLGVAFVILIGNLLVGKPDTGSSRSPLRPDIFLSSAQEQRDYVVEHFPRAGKDIKTYIVAGRRDLSFRGKQAYSIIRDICERRPDLVYRGDHTNTFDVRGLKIVATNPYDDNGPQGKTYGVQQIADSLDDPHPDILLVAGMHRYSLIPDYWNDGFGYVCLVPSMHTQMTRQRTKHAPVRPDVGVAVLDINFNERDERGKPKVLYTGYNLNQYADYSNSEYLEASPEYIRFDLNKKETEILRMIYEAKELGISIGEISRKTKLGRKSVNAIINKFQTELGYPIEVPEDVKRVIIQQRQRTHFLPIKFDVMREVEVGIVSDTHLTSTHQQIKLLKKAYEVFEQRQINVVFHAGDVSEGPPTGGYRSHNKDVVGGDSDRLLDYVVERYPTFSELAGAERDKQHTTVMISGNHDNWGKELDFVKALSARRPDILYLGKEYGHYTADGVYYYLLHPRGASGDTLSRKLEKNIRVARNRASKGKGNPRLFILGNWHQAIAFFDRDILGLLAPCLKSEDTFHATLALVPKLGFWIVKLGLDKNNNILNFTPEYFGFTEKDIDAWDYTDIHAREIEKADREKEEFKRLSEDT